MTVPGRKILSPTKKEVEGDLALVSTVVNETKNGKIKWQYGFAEGWHGDYVADWRGRKLSYTWLQDGSPRLRIFDASGDQELVEVAGSLHTAHGLLIELGGLIHLRIDPHEEQRLRQMAKEAVKHYRTNRRQQLAEIERLLR